MEKINSAVIFPTFFEDENFRTCPAFYFPALELLFLEHSKLGLKIGFSSIETSPKTKFNLDTHKQQITSQFSFYIIIMGMLKQRNTTTS